MGESHFSDRQSFTVTKKELLNRLIIAIIASEHRRLAVGCPPRTTVALYSRNKYTLKDTREDLCFYGC